MIILKQKSYTFSDYFELNYPTEDIIAELGYQYQLTKLKLPCATLKHTLNNLQAMFYKKLPHIALTSETAKREVMIAPIILELLDEIDIKINIEYPIYVNEYLKGNIDYWLHSAQECLIIEAKKSDMEKGFTQLAVELIAMDSYLKTANNLLYGAVTIGDSWRFGKLNRDEKCMYRDIDSFRVPLDLNELFQILVGILNGNDTEKTQ